MRANFFLPAGNHCRTGDVAKNVEKSLAQNSPADAFPAKRLEFSRHHKEGVIQQLCARQLISCHLAKFVFSVAVIVISWFSDILLDELSTTAEAQSTMLLFSCGLWCECSRV